MTQFTKYWDSASICMFHWWRHVPVQRRWQPNVTHPSDLCSYHVHSLLLPYLPCSLTLTMFIKACFIHLFSNFTLLRQLQGQGPWSWRLKHKSFCCLVLFGGRQGVVPLPIFFNKLFVRYYTSLPLAAAWWRIPSTFT